MTDLTTTSAVEQFLSLPSGNKDQALLGVLITVASAFLEGYCGRSFARQSYTEIRDGKGTREMFVRNAPIAAVSELVIGVDPVPAGSQSAAGYMFDENRIVLNGYRFARGMMNVKIVYTGGFGVVPADLAQACIELVTLRYKEIAHFDTSSKAIAGETTSFVMTDMKSSTRTALVRYSRNTGL